MINWLKEIYIRDIRDFNVMTKKYELGKWNIWVFFKYCYQNHVKMRCKSHEKGDFYPKS